MTCCLKCRRGSRIGTAWSCRCPRRFAAKRRHSLTPQGADRLDGILHSRIDRGKRVALLDRGQVRPEISKQPVVDRIDPAMQMQRLSSKPGILHDRRRRDTTHLHLDIDLAHQIEPPGHITCCIEGRAVFLVQHGDRLQPVIEQGIALGCQCAGDAAAAVVATDDDVLRRRGGSRRTRERTEC